MQTRYSYDVLGNLIGVTQCGGTCPSSLSVNRSFTYDGLSRLIQSFNPESGWTCYGSSGGAAPNGGNCTSGYDANGNLSLKTDARAVVSNYSYDGLNRILKKSFSADASATPSSCYQYDSSSVPNSVGRMTSEWTQGSSAGSCSSPTGGVLSKREIKQFDAMGRILQEYQYTPAVQAGGTHYSLDYAYDLTGNLYSSSNGTTARPISFTYTLNSAGRLQTVTSSWTNLGAYPAQLFSAQRSTSQPCANSLPESYTAFGSLMNAQFGGGSLTLNRAYDKRLRITCEIDKGSGITPATPGAVSLTITGNEQSK
jgi:YD repeat-containing protein